MPKFKNIRLKMKGGKTRMQRVQVLASGKYKFVKNTGSSPGSRSRKLTRTVKKTTRRIGKLARRRGRRGSRKFTLPLAPIAGLLAAPAVGATIKAAMAGDVDGVLYEAKKFVGFTGDQFDAFALGSNVLPIVSGLLIHKFVGGAPLNLNRMLASAGVPFIRI